MNGEPLDPSGLYSIAVTGLRDDAAHEAVAEYLASVMRGRTLMELRNSLERLPFSVTRSVSGGVAQKLKDRLEERGASLEVVSLAPEAAMPGIVSPAKAEDLPSSEPARKASDPVPVQYSSASAGPTIPWEDRDEQGFFASLWGTFTEVMFSPADFYSRMPRKGRIGSALLYAAIFGVLGLILSAPTVFLTRFSLIGSLPFPREDIYPLLVGAYTFGIFFSPLFVVLGYFVLAVIYHPCIILVGGTGGFEATLKVLAYSAATNVFQVLPFLGGVVSGVYNVVVWSAGFQKAHALSPGRAIFAVIFPALVLFVLGMAVLALIIFTMGMAVLQGLFQRLHVSAP